MTPAAQASQSLAYDTRELERLKHSASDHADNGVRATAEKFEGMFIRQMLSSMREAMPESDLIDSDSMDTYREMLDSQLSNNLAGKGFGLADKIADALAAQAGRGPEGGSATQRPGIAQADVQALKPSASLDSIQAQRELAAQQPVTATDGAPKVSSEPDNRLVSSAPGPVINMGSSAPATDRSDMPTHVADFLERFQGPAESAAGQTGLSRELILAQAALETGWGRHESQTADGSPTYNVFNIKATGWDGRSAQVATHEFVDGERQATQDGFRAYDSYEQAFDDYARLINGNARYAAAGQAPTDRAAAEALQSGGYATDPAYADKLVAVAESLPELGDSAGDPRMQERGPLVDMDTQRASLI